MTLLRFVSKSVLPSKHVKYGQLSASCFCQLGLILKKKAVAFAFFLSLHLFLLQPGNILFESHFSFVRHDWRYWVCASSLKASCAEAANPQALESVLLPGSCSVVIFGVWSSL